MNFICIFQVNLIKQIYTLLSNFFQITIYHGYLHKLVQRVSNCYLFCTVYTQIHIHTLTYDFCITQIIHTSTSAHIFLPYFQHRRAKQQSCESKTKSVNKQDTNSEKKMYIYTHTLYLTDTMSIHLIHSAYQLIRKKKKNKQKL